MRAKATESTPLFVIKNGKVITKGYGYIATSVMDDYTITRGAKLLYVYLVCKAGVSDCCYPKISTIMKSMGIQSKITFRDYKDELIEKKLLIVEERTYKSGQKTSNYYYPAKMKRESE